MLFNERVRFIPHSFYFHLAINLENLENVIKLNIMDRKELTNNCKILFSLPLVMTKLFEYLTKDENFSIPKEVYKVYISSARELVSNINMSDGVDIYNFKSKYVKLVLDKLFNQVDSNCNSDIGRAIRDQFVDLIADTKVGVEAHYDMTLKLAIKLSEEVDKI